VIALLFSPRDTSAGVDHSGSRKCIKATYKAGKRGGDSIARKLSEL
jgi:hypothetical protein